VSVEETFSRCAANIASAIEAVGVLVIGFGARVIAPTRVELGGLARTFLNYFLEQDLEK
jgi:hypothetical protein